MQLSVIIVSYNVRFFLDQAIGSVFSSDCDFDYEIIVVDNGSNDDSVDWVKKKYPSVRVFDLGKNVGFAKANNFAAKKANGECILLLNPDTIVQSDSLQLCYNHLMENDEVGAVGLRMYDGQGKYLPESKRGFPSPWTSFCKITGLNELFPTSKTFNYYYLGHKSSDVDQKVDVLTGAFIMLRRNRYLELGGLDEDFFMYGEDIDLCFRLAEKGFQNYYLASSSIIHFKGESTSKGSLKYIKTFYRAMSIYAGKHYNKHFLALMSFFIQGAIYARAGLAILFQSIRKVRLFLQHFSFIFLGLILENFLSYGELHFNIRFLIPPLLFASCSRILALNGTSWSWWNHFIAWAVVSLLILPIAVMAASPLWPTAIILGLVYYLLRLIRAWPDTFLPQLQKSHTAISWASEAAKDDLKRMLDQLPGQHRITQLSPADRSTDQHEMAQQSQELIFDPTYLSWSEIVTYIITDGKEKINRILSPEYDCLITCRSKNEAAILITEHLLQEKRLQPVDQLKRRHDFIFSLLILCLSPFIAIIYGTNSLRKAVKVVFQGTKWFSDESPRIRFDARSSGQEQRAAWINRQQYLFASYQRQLWNDLRKA
ncbi:MAG: glycosyltransferase [Bacteroidetes bacterium]|jgi:GT2 family glycosyltransferase|nr:glycosyltransferase [Bacteroidota bacterium]